MNFVNWISCASLVNMVNQLKQMNQVKPLKLSITRVTSVNSSEAILYNNSITSRILEFAPFQANWALDSHPRCSDTPLDIACLSDAM